jgi:hypothetical protein
MWHGRRPTHQVAWWSLACTLGYALLWLGQVLVIDVWAQTPIDDFSRRLTIMISYAVVQIGVGIVAGGLALWSVWRHGERSRWLWAPLVLAGVLLVAVVRAMVMP